MNYAGIFFKRTLAAFFCLGAGFSFAIATPKFSILPIPPLPSVIYITNTATATYEVTNNTFLTRTLTMVPVSGVTHVGGTCTPPAFTLAPGARCTLILLITASQLPSGGVACRTEGDLTLCTPEICKTLGFGNNNPDPFLCSQPSSANSLTVRSTTTPSLTSDVDALALSVTSLGGTPRIIRVTNNSAYVVTNITATPSALPPGTTIALTPLNCAVIAPGEVCTITISPGDSTTNSPFNLAVRGDGTNTLNFTIDVLKYGSSYQSGLVFSIDNSPPNYESVSGKVVTDTDQSAGIVWSTFDSSIYAIDENSIPTAPSPATGQISPQMPCNGKSDGACDTKNIVIFYNANAVSRDSYAAGVCDALTNDYDDWYLPAICEMGYGTNCGIPPAPPLMQNIQTNIVDTGTTGAPSGVYWSSTESAAFPLTDAWFQGFDASPTQNFVLKSNTFKVRCVRVFNP